MGYSYTYYSDTKDHGGWTATLQVSCGHEMVTANDSITINMEGAAQYSSNNACYYGVNVQVGHDAVSNPSYPMTWNDGYGVLYYTNWVGSTTASYKFTRTHSNYTVRLWAAAQGATVNGYGPAPEHAAGGKNITIPARPSYSVSYNANGGSGAPSAQTKWYGESLALSSTKPTRTGYTFKQWNTKSDGTGTAYAAGASYTGNAALTLYAIWTINTWSVTYNGNGSTGGSTAAQTKTYNTALTLRSNGFTRTNYVFKNWNTKADGTGTSYAAGASYTGNAALTLYAQWYAPYTVSYNANGGSGTVSSQTKVYNTALTLRSNAYTRSGYSFWHWNTTATNTGTTYAAGASYTANAAATMYAIWNPYIYFDANGGSGAPSAQLKTYGTALTLSSTVPTRAGFSFRSWNTSSGGTGTTFLPGDSYTSNATATLYAMWDATVTYDANGGTEAPSSQVSAYGSTVVLSDKLPIRAGHTFLEWNTAQDGTGTSYQPGDQYNASGGNLSLYAKWRVDIIVSDISVKLVNANGDDDPLGRYLRVRASYDTTASGSECTEFSASVTHSGVDDVDSLPELGYVGSADWMFGPYVYGDFDPHGGYSVGTLTAANADGEVTRELFLESTLYENPFLLSLSAFRVEMSVVDGVMSLEEADDGTCLGLEVSWLVTSTPTQSVPSEVGLVLTDLETGDVVAERSFRDVTSNPAVLYAYPDSRLWPDDVLVDGVLVNEQRRYLVNVTVSDAYSDAVATAKSSGSEMVTWAYFTTDALAGGHGYAIGKPATREMFDVGMQAQFDKALLIAEAPTLPVYFYTGNVPSESEVKVKPSLLVPFNAFIDSDGYYALEPSIWLCVDVPKYSIVKLGSNGWKPYEDTSVRSFSGTSTADAITWDLEPGRYRIDVEGVYDFGISATMPDNGGYSLTVYEPDTVRRVGSSLKSGESNDATVSGLEYGRHKIYMEYTAPSNGNESAILEMDDGLLWKRWLQDDSISSELGTQAGNTSYDDYVDSEAGWPE